MDNSDVKSLAHTKWNCKYHIVFAPKYRRKVFYSMIIFYNTPKTIDLDESQGFSFYDRLNGENLYQTPEKRSKYGTFCKRKT